ncbi:hypothetical protein F2P81_015648 [Scophthalmus maximus]|uniref:Astrotactin-1/2 N-terminal domain-containing protein n=1 Tax=Scophthalmus maximus TaxID=52904 RepID=A0A6A4SA19_SCOMX|nr:hypothetical protein F2P81_015648 [Scophthalmus maximus]
MGSASENKMSGTGEDISQVHWKQQWLENGTLFFHVSMTESELVAQTTQPTAREPAHVLHEHMHLLHISVMLDVPLIYLVTRCHVKLLGHCCWTVFPECHHYTEWNLESVITR